MVLSVRETAVLLGRSERQVRYLLKQGYLPGKKRGKSWIIMRSDLYSVFPELAEHVERNLNTMREATNDVFTRVEQSIDKRSYRSIRDLRVFLLANDVLQAIKAAHPEESNHIDTERITDVIKHGMRYLALGCHHYHKDDKNRAFNAARECFSNAAMELFVCAREAKYNIFEEQLTVVERDLIPGIGALIKSITKKTS